MKKKIQTRLILTLFSTSKFFFFHYLILTPKKKKCKLNKKKQNKIRVDITDSYGEILYPC